jgi:hypothetical protein
MKVRQDNHQAAFGQDQTSRTDYSEADLHSKSLSMSLMTPNMGATFSARQPPRDLSGRQDTKLLTDDREDAT